MAELILAILVFVASHAIPALGPVRSFLTARLGERTFLVLYTLVTLVLVVWLGLAYAEAPYMEVWEFAMWMRWVPMLVMPFACILLVAGLSSPNPLSVGPGAKKWNPERPGIVSVTRHPLMWVFILWAAAHMAPNGDLAGLLLFGLLLGLGLAGPVSLDAKYRTRLGREEWRRMAAPTSNLPLAAWVAGRTRIDLAGIGWTRFLGGLALYVALLFLHPWLFGADPLPFQYRLG